jgi:hypothetical protein
VLYPELASSRDSAVAALAQRFSKEMASTTPQIVAYNNRWHTPSVIKSDPSRFIAETNQVIKILADRINRENLELYAVADAIEARSA